VAERSARDEGLLGTELVLDVGGPVHGGACLARNEGRVVFVRHALPGERVRARVTEDRDGSFLRADAVEIIEPALDRVAPPCPHAGPGRCGGCDWQHATAERQRALKADVVRDQFRRQARVELGDLFTGVDELPGGLLGWRTRITYAVGPGGRLGLHRHRSHHVEVIDACPLGMPGVGDADVLTRRWPKVTGVEVVRGDDGEVAVLEHRPGPGRQARGRRPPDQVAVVQGPSRVTRTVAGRPMTVSAGGFWQVHPHAVDAFAAALDEMLRPSAGETVLDLYSGAGALTALLADAVGQTGRVVALESDRTAVADAQRNLDHVPWVEVRQGRVDAASVAAAGAVGAVDLVVLDPPRAGAGPEVMQAILGAGARGIGYVACDPASLARDVRIALDAGWRLAALRGFDAFPMTHHVECVAHLAPPDGAARPVMT
jgi:tRNA/tmRNA/rRNA uracil-C5-methylase (TrmA/RlmC/RlmD family)